MFKKRASSTSRIQQLIGRKGRKEKGKWRERISRISRVSIGRIAIASTLGISACVSLWKVPAQAEGSRNMFPNGAPGNRGHIVWQSGSAAGFRRRTLLRVFANAGENILVGSSAVDVGNGNILIFDPGTVTGQVANETLPAT
ncbi:MAG: hypothetical protein AAFY72_13385, partial [Cyanobacteria bacterium J06649_4]